MTIEQTPNFNAFQLSCLRIIHMLPGLEFRMYDIGKATISLLGDLTNGKLCALEVTPAGVEVLRRHRLDVFGRLHNDIHEIEFRDRLAAVRLPYRSEAA